MKRILFTDKVHPLLWESLTAAGFHCHDGSVISLAETEQLLPQFDGIVVRSRFRIDEAFLSKAACAAWRVGVLARNTLTWKRRLQRALRY